MTQDLTQRRLAEQKSRQASPSWGFASILPCVILLDVMMPIMDGWQFRVLQQESPALSGRFS